MYETPDLEVYGSFRDMTLSGKSGMWDGVTLENNDNNPGCNPNSVGNSSCPTS